MIFRMFFICKNLGREYLKFGWLENIWSGGSYKLKYEVNKLVDKYEIVPPVQGASELTIRELTGLFEYLFYSYLFPSQINIVSPKHN